jgi:HAMP domain-containing protein
MDEMIRLEKRKRELEDAIRETEKRLPAHSVKPPVMMDLLAYEDEYERVVAAIRTLRDNGKSH